MAKNADHAEQPVVNYLLAAEAAQQRGDEARANQHLERATELAGDDLIPVEITRVRLQLARNEITPRAMASISCWKLPRVIRKCCASPNRHTPAPAPGSRCWTSFRRWRKLTSAMKRTARRWNSWPGLADG